MNAWQPIETAPKDGTWILSASDEHGVCIVHYSYGDWYQDNESGLPLDDLTHWMPLPLPPTKE